MELTEKYRPKTLDEIIGQNKVINHIKHIIKNEHMPNMTFIGTAGTGKTTTAYAIANEKEITISELNASDERGIDNVRKKIKTLSKIAGKRIILLDEFDSMTKDAQHALRRIMERKSPNVYFILTANYEHKIIDPIISRTAVYHFDRLSDNDLAKVLFNIIKKEDIKYEKQFLKDSIKALILYSKGDARKSINKLDSIISDEKELSPETVKMLFIPGKAKSIINHAITGKWKESIRGIEDYTIIESNLPYIIDDFYDAISKSDMKEDTKMRLFLRLHDVERNLKLGCSPIIQITSLVAETYLSEFGT